MKLGSVELLMQTGKGYVPYVKNFLKKLIVEVESNHGDVLDELYEKYAYIMTSLKVRAHGWRFSYWFFFH